MVGFDRIQSSTSCAMVNNSVVANGSPTGVD